MKAMKANDSGTQNLKKNIMAVAAVIERFKRVFILVAAICIVICAVSAAAEDLPGTEYPPLLSLNAQEIRFPRGKKYPVYSGPGKDYLRGARGKASVSTNDWIGVFGQEDGWILIQYEIDSSRCRIGYISAQSLPKNCEVPDLPFLRQTAYAIKEISVTDDPLRSASSLSSLPAGAEVTILAALGNDVYIEGKSKDRFRGFVPSDNLSWSPDSLVPIDLGKAETRRVGSVDLEQAEQDRAYDALGMWLREMEGAVSLFDQDGNQLEAETDMRMSSGTALETEEKSLAAVDMDLERLAILAEASRAGFMSADQGAGISIALQAGEMYFRVGQPLENGESFEIVLDDIVLAIRGTCGLVQIGETEQSVLLASGHAMMTRETEDPAVNEEIPVVPREMVSFTKQTDGSVSVSRREISEEEVPEFLVEALRKDPEQLERVCEETGWDAEKLFPDGVPVRESDQADEVMDYYQTIIREAERYDFFDYGEGIGKYQYAIVYLDEDTIPTLLLAEETNDMYRYLKFFHYDPEQHLTIETMTSRSEYHNWYYTRSGNRGLLQWYADGAYAYGIKEVYIENGEFKSKDVWYEENYDKAWPADLPQEEIQWNDIP